MSAAVTPGLCSPGAARCPVSVTPATMRQTQHRGEGRSVTQRARGPRGGERGGDGALSEEQRVYPVGAQGLNRQESPHPIQAPRGGTANNHKLGGSRQQTFILS